MAKRFEFDPELNLYAYSVEGLIELCKNNKNLAYTHIYKGSIETWLFKIGENELSDLVNQTRHDPEFMNKQNNWQQVDFMCERLSNKLNNRKFLELLDIDKAIEITLKEYETLRSEILQNASEISQLILLGLAAIFTIASIGLAPLSDFLTEEDTTIQMPLTVENVSEIIPDDAIKVFNDIKVIKKGFNKALKLRDFNQPVKDEIETKIKEDPILKKGLEGELDLDNAKVIIVGTSNEVEYYLKITRATNGKTIEELGLVPSIVIFNWLIPVLSLFLISRSLGNLQKNKVIGEYVYTRVEQKLVNLSILRKNYLKFENKKIDDQVINNDYRQYLTHISWENYIVERGKNYSGPSDLDLIFYLFTPISVISFVGGTALLMFDFSRNQWFWDDGQSREFILVDFVISLLPLFLILTIVIITIFIVSEQANFNQTNKVISLVVGGFLGLILSCIIIYFFEEIMTGEDILNTFKFSCLLVIPFLVYSWFVCISLMKKSEVDNQILRKKKDKNSKKNVDINQVIHEVMDEMWDKNR